MASYRLSAQVISAGKGQTGTAATAYRSGEKVRDEEKLCHVKTSKAQETLDRGEVSERFRNQLEKKGVSISENAAVEKKENCWEVTDGDKSYTIREHMTGKKEPRPQLSIYENKEHDYTKREGVEHTEIFTPEGAQEWTKNRSELHNTIKAAETHQNARYVREVQVSLPRELDLEQNKALVKEFVEENFTSKGMVADVAIHESEAGDGGKNPHVHILLTMRELDGNGFADNKNREWDKTELLKEWRENWADTQNEHLEKASSSVTVDHRTLKEQNIDRKPEIHMGKDAWHMEKKGVETQKGNENREVHHKNAVNERVRVNTGRNVDRHHLNRGHSIQMAFNQVPQEVKDRLNEVRDRVTAQHQERQEQRAAGFEKYAWAMNYQRNEAMGEIKENVLNPIINQQSTERTEALRQELRNAMQPRPEPVTQNPERSQDSATVQQSEREEHSQTLAQVLKNTTLQTVQKQVNFIRDYGQTAIEKTVQVGRNIFDEYASLAEKTGAEKEQQPERNQEQTAIEKIIEAGSSIFDKYASMVKKTETEQEQEQERSRERERDRDYER